LGYTVSVTVDYLPLAVMSESGRDYVGVLNLNSSTGLDGVNMDFFDSHFMHDATVASPD
tara:strand:- start:1246 stop:1422 length:177 start_codon:yes stop_codon:yes gene_type:complete